MEPGILSKKYFGVPVVYYAGSIVGVLVYVAWKSTKSTTPDVTGDVPATDTTTNASGDASGGDGNYSGFIANPTPTYTSTDTTADTTTIDTNAAWLNRATSWGIEQGLGGAGEVQSALSAYLDGSQLSYAQGVIRDAAVKQFGLPPDPPTPGGTTIAPAKRQGTPPTYHTVQGANDDTIAELATLYYGSGGVAAGTSQIAVKNAGLPPTGTYSSGTRVFIPAFHNASYYTATKSVSTLHQFAVKGGTTSQYIQQMNPNLKFPVKVGTKVRIS